MADKLIPVVKAEGEEEDLVDPQVQLRVPICLSFAFGPYCLLPFFITYIMFSNPNLKVHIFMITYQYD